MEKVDILVFEPNADGRVMQIKANGELQTLQKIVGGYIEYVPTPFEQLQKFTFYANEEGLILELPRNRGFWGTFVVLKYDDTGDGYESLTDEEINLIKSIYDGKKTFFSKNEYLATYFKEKQVPPDVFSYTTSMGLIQLSNYDVIEALLESDDQILKQAEEKIRQIDFVNGDINHFLHYLGKSLAKQITESLER